MDRGVKKPWSYLAASVLAIFTLLTFFRLQNYGPQSVLRTFHEAISKRDGKLADTVVRDGIDSSAMRQVMSFLSPVLVQSSSYELVESRRPNSNTYLAAVEYRTPQGVFPFVWVLTKNDNTWKIDAQATDTIFLR